MITNLPRRQTASFLGRSVFFILAESMLLLVLKDVFITNCIAVIDTSKAYLTTKGAQLHCSRSNVRGGYPLTNLVSVMGYASILVLGP